MPSTSSISLILVIMGCMTGTLIEAFRHIVPPLANDPGIMGSKKKRPATRHIISRLLVGRDSSACMGMGSNVGGRELGGQYFSEIVHYQPFRPTDTLSNRVAFMATKSVLELSWKTKSKYHRYHLYYLRQRANEGEI